jgi:dihydropteroate synthase
MAKRTVIRPARQWITRGRNWPLEDRPLLMGVLNVTPDSFSDGGQFADPRAAIAHAERMIAEGADLIDVGGESSRPGAAPVDADEEIRRIRPIVEALAESEIPVSIDTAKAAVARVALAAGALVVNDVSAGRSDPSLPRVAAEHGAGYIAMHMRGEPRTMQDAPQYRDVVAEVAEELEAWAEAIEAAGVAREAIAIDPGIGFGKDLEHNLQLLGHLDQILTLGRPVAVGCSRKSFIGRLTGAEAGERLPGTIAAHLFAWARGAQILRVHDVVAARHSLTVWQAIAEGQGGTGDE